MLRWKYTFNENYIGNSWGGASTVSRKCKCYNTHVLPPQIYSKRLQRSPQWQTPPPHTHTHAHTHAHTHTQCTPTFQNVHLPSFSIWLSDLTRPTWFLLGSSSLGIVYTDSPFYILRNTNTSILVYTWWWCYQQECHPSYLPYNCF